MVHLLPSGLLVFALGGFAVPVQAAQPCRPAAIAAALAPAADADDAVRLTCNLTLGPGDVVTRRLVLEGGAARGVRIDCRGGRIGDPSRPPSFPNATIEVRSLARGGAAWEAPSDIVIRNCTIAGPVRIWGMGGNGQAEAVKLSSRQLGHTERAQAAAPRRIVIDNATFVAAGPTPLYLAPGVTQVTLRGSRLTGRASAIAVYMDAESARNTLIGNVFEIETGREVVAVDGSAHNTISGNVFRIGQQGGIYLYRNCGEGGTVRHQTPSYNRIKGNRFAYASPVRFAPVNVGARAGWGLNCEEDSGYPFGSSIDNGDGATGNEVAGNVVE